MTRGLRLGIPIVGRIARILRSIHIVTRGQSIIFEVAIFRGPARFVVWLVLVMMHELLYVDPGCPLLTCHCNNQTFNNTFAPSGLHPLLKRIAGEREAIVCLKSEGN